MQFTLARVRECCYTDPNKILVRMNGDIDLYMNESESMMWWYAQKPTERGIEFTWNVGWECYFVFFPISGVWGWDGMEWKRGNKPGFLVIVAGSVLLRRRNSFKHDSPKQANNDDNRDQWRTSLLQESLCLPTASILLSLNFISTNPSPYRSSNIKQSQPLLFSSLLFPPTLSHSTLVPLSHATTVGNSIHSKSSPSHEQITRKYSI